MGSAHIVKSYDDDLKTLQAELLHMGELVISALEKSLNSLVNSDSVLAKNVITEDDAIDEIEHRIDAFAIKMIALRQPVAQDLRSVVTALKISSHLERMGDYASNIARRGIGLMESEIKCSTQALESMVLFVSEMIRNVLDAYVRVDLQLAMDIWHMDEKVDAMYLAYLRELLTYMIEDPRNITPCIHVLFAAKNMERMGDHVTNIAEMVYYLVHGEPFKEPRR
jgi:phosphate transport system protein